MDQNVVAAPYEICHGTMLMTFNKSAIEKLRETGLIPFWG